MKKNTNPLDDYVLGLMKNTKIFNFDTAARTISYMSTYQKLKLYTKNHKIQNKKKIYYATCAILSNHDFISGILNFDKVEARFCSIPIDIRKTHKIKRHLRLGGCDLYLWRDDQLNEIITCNDQKNTGNFILNFDQEETDSIKKLCDDLLMDIQKYELEQERKRIDEKKVFETDFDLEETVFNL